MKRRVRGRKKSVRKNQRPILERVLAALYAVVQRAVRQKMVAGAEPWVFGAHTEAKSVFDPTQRGRGPHHLVEVAVEWCSQGYINIKSGTT